MMWALQPTGEFDKKQRKWPKKYHRELKNMLDNLSTFHRSLCMGGTPQSAAQAGFVHPEPSGVVAVDQSGPGAGLKRTRLYVYPDVDSRTLHLITVGDKSSQGADIKFSREFVAGLLKQEEGERKSDSEGG